VFNRIIVPTDGSDAAWRAVIVGSRLATQSKAGLELLYVADDAVSASTVTRSLRQRLADDAIGPGTVRVMSAVRLRSVATTIAEHVESTNGGIVVMSSHGHGRSAAVLGNVATKVLRETCGPTVIVGPRANLDRPDFRGSLLVAVDGSPFSETALGVAGELATDLGSVAWVTTVISTANGNPYNSAEAAYPRQLAKTLRSLTHRPVEFEVLHAREPASAIADFAAEIDASLIVASTHGRTGAARLAFGSVAAAIVRHAPCPVILLRPPAIPERTRPMASVYASPIG
jgi:nucleotide-binding universal stress UspA family protein